MTAPTPADTLARLVAWLVAVDAALAGGADPGAVLEHMLAVSWRIEAGLAALARVPDLDAAYQARTWRRVHGCETL